MDYVYTGHYPVGTRSVDKHNQCRASALLSYLQEATTDAAVEIGFPRETMMERFHCFWMLVRIWFRLERPLGWNEVLTVRTWHRGGRGVTMTRDYDLFAGDAPVGEGVSAWVLADQDTRQMLRLSAIREFAGSTGGSLCKNIHLRKILMPNTLLYADDRKLRYSDTDINAHVNNARYADFATDALEPACFRDDRYLAEMQVGYLAECLPGELLQLHRGGQGDTHYVRGVGAADGKARFDARLRFAPTPARG